MTSRFVSACALAIPLTIVLACGGNVTGLGNGSDASTTDASTGSDAVNGTDGTTTRDAIGVDGVVTSDVGSSGIPCGAVTCDSTSQECCFGHAGGSCIPKGGACDGGITLTCSGPEDCPVAGDVCCAEASSGGAGASCTTEAACHGLILCQTDEDCPDMERCEMVLEGYKICRHGGFGPDGGFHRPDGGFHPPDGGFVPPDGAVPP
jgi:hypothetical protein